MYFSYPIIFDIQKFAEVYWVINPLRLDVFLRLLLCEIFSVSYDVSYIGINSSQWNCSPIGQDNILKRVSGNFSTKVKVKAVEEQVLILLMLINKLLVNLILFILIIILCCNLFKVVSLISWQVRLSWWIFEANTGVQFEVDEFY